MESIRCPKDLHDIVKLLCNAWIHETCACVPGYEFCKTMSLIRVFFIPSDIFKMYVDDWRFSCFCSETVIQRTLGSVEKLPSYLKLSTPFFHPSLFREYDVLFCSHKNRRLNNRGILQMDTDRSLSLSSSTRQMGSLHLAPQQCYGRRNKSNERVKPIPFM